MFDNKLLVIPEIANSHAGSVSKALDLVKAISGIGCECVKFQIFEPAELYKQTDEAFDLFKTLTLPREAWEELFQLSRAFGLNIFCDVFGQSSLDLATELGCDAFKLHLSDIRNLSFVSAIAEHNKPVFLSVSGASLNEIFDVIYSFRSRGIDDVTLMHGFQRYPTNLEDTNLSRVNTLKSIFDLKIGYADHTSGDDERLIEHLALAIGQGATVIEKHITLSRTEGGVDHYSSLVPAEFARMLKSIRLIEKMIGNKNFSANHEERKYRLSVEKIPFAKVDMQKGHIIEQHDLIFSRVSNRETQSIDRSVTGSTLIADVKEGEKITTGLFDYGTRTLAILACRIGSSRLFAKPLQMIGEVSILEHLIQNLKKCEKIDEVVLAISDVDGNDSFKKIAFKHNLKFIFGSEEDVLGRILTAVQAFDADYIVRVTTEDPFKCYELMDEAISQHISRQLDYTSYLHGLPYGAGFEILSRGLLESAFLSKNTKHHSELATSFVTENLESYKTLLFEPSGKINRPDIRLTVDFPEDLVLARALVSNALSGSYDLSLENIILHIDTDKYLSELHTNAQLAAKQWGGHNV